MKKRPQLSRPLAVLAALGLGAGGCAPATWDDGGASAGDSPDGGSSSPPSTAGSTGGGDGSTGILPKDAASGAPADSSGGPKGGPSDGASNEGATGDGAVPSCTYTDDPSFCACLGNYDCGGVTIKDATGTNRTVFCGGCAGGEWCVLGALGIGIGTCGGKSPLVYQWQRDKINMLVSMGENDNTVINYPSCANIKDGRGYTIGQVGFCTGTGDFIVVAQCYNDRKPNNVLSKYFDALVSIDDQFLSTGLNQGSTTALDAIGKFCNDVATAAAEADGIFDRCQDDVGDADYMAGALAHVQERGFQGVETLGFLYDTELNFGEGDDPGGLGGTATVMKRADADYGAGLPTDFAGKIWEESRWLGFMIQERTVEMTGDKTWKSDIDQNATWEAARRSHTAKSNTPESATDLGMTYDLSSVYKAGAGSGPCWKSPPLLSAGDSQSSIYTVGLDKSASATDQSKWKATGGAGSGGYTACPANPTP